MSATIEMEKAIRRMVSKNEKRRKERYTVTIVTLMITMPHYVSSY